MLEGLVNHSGWQVEGRGLRPPVTAGRGLSPSLLPQALLETLGSEPLGQLTTSPTGQSAN